MPLPLHRCRRQRERSEATQRPQTQTRPRLPLGRHRALSRLAMAAALALGWAPQPMAAFAADEPPMDLAWAKLQPPAPPLTPSQALKAKSFLSGATPWTGAGGSEPPPPPVANDKAWLSEKRLQPGAGASPAVVLELDGKRVRIGGYVVPLDFEAANVKEFLLVPFVGACIHVPPPPPNQIVYVKAIKGFDVQGSFDPVWVTGTLKTASQYTGLAETGYSIEDGKVEIRKE
jgi:uncharacterized protein